MADSIQTKIQKVWLESPILKYQLECKGIAVSEQCYRELLKELRGSHRFGDLSNPRDIHSLYMNLPGPNLFSRLKVYITLNEFQEIGFIL